MTRTPIDLPPLPACISRGTLIDTYHGPLPVEDLVVDDQVMTRDEGFRPVRWIGCFRAEARGRLSPVRIAPGALGNNRSLIVSQHQLLLLNDWRAELLFGEREVLAPARALVNEDTIWIQEGGIIDYYAILMDRHQILYVEESFAGSLQPSSPGCEVMGPELVPQMRIAAQNTGSDRAARLVLKPFEVRAMRNYIE
ncbi:Hint domain-containing protein [Falsirhodobacter sp. 20TX0035]|uniref:Hint domain-containing protein n=1 Tax=Falsirhodobacter sp. 20TX0035 TaxID=3022019 RepID=UPI00232FC9D1|nr:Hint domain-containing protein [Falsirhodobacter sp. 20TX0035]MDB6453545.1 Hint domain-containing protein [Falsirhodobacter sp. 20TX0035]